MAKAYLSVLFDGKEIRRCGGNSKAIRELIFQYRINPEKYHPWLVNYKDYHDRIKLRTRKSND